MLLGGGVLFGMVEVPLGDVLLGVLPGTQGVATVVEVPLGCDGVADATVELPPVEGVPLAVEGVLPVAVPLVDGVLPVALPLLFDGVQGATVVLLPVAGVVLCVVLGELPVTVPLLVDVPDVPCVVEELPIELGAGCEVGRVPAEPVVPVEVVPVDVVPGCVVVVVPGVPCVDDVPGVPIPVLGLAVPAPVVCAVANPTDSASTDDASKILRIESCSLWFADRNLRPRSKSRFIILRFLSGMQVRAS